MKRFITIALLLACGVGAGEQPAPPTLPPVPTAEELLALPAEELLAARESVKKVMLHRALRQKDDAARITLENVAECLALARRLHAPEPFIRMLELEAADSFSGRALHEYRDAFNRLVAAYGVDAVQMRLYTENQSYSTAEMRRVLESIPLRGAFNLVPRVHLDVDAVEAQLTMLGRVYACMAEVYAGVNSREEAEAAADALLPLLEDYDSTATVRMILMASGEPEQNPLFARLALPAAKRCMEQRRRLMETDYYGSRRLSTLDFLLN